MLEYLRRQLEALLARRAAARANVEAIIAATRTESRAPTADESARITAGMDEIRAMNDEETALNTQIAAAEETERREAQAAQARATGGQTGQNGPRAVITSEPQVYGRGSAHSYFHDMAVAKVRGDAGPVERLARHAAELRVELPKREAAREARARAQADGMAGEERFSDSQRANMFEQRTNPNRTDGTGGYFVPPLWLIDEYVGLPRFGRPIADSVRNLELPAGTDSINLPKVSTGTATAAQTDGGSVTSTDMTDTSVSASVYTVAGQQDVAMQLLDQSPSPGFDAVVMGDLLADLAVRQDVYVINGSGSAGQPTGILNVSSINTVTYTDASPTLIELWPSWVQSVSTVFTNRKAPATATFVIPAIWYWACAALDGNSRPLILPTQDNVAFNPMALQTGAISEGPVGRLTVGTPVILDGNIPTNLGGGSNETRIITARTSDLYLWEGPVQTRVLTEVLSGTLQVRFQAYRYAAFMGNRLPKAIAVISGTGVIPASGY